MPSPYTTPAGKPVTLQLGDRHRGDTFALSDAITVNYGASGTFTGTTARVVVRKGSPQGAVILSKVLTVTPNATGYAIAAPELTGADWTPFGAEASGAYVAEVEAVEPGAKVLTWLVYEFKLVLDVAR